MIDLIRKNKTWGYWGPVGLEETDWLKGTSTGQPMVWRPKTKSVRKMFP